MRRTAPAGRGCSRSRRPLKVPPASRSICPTRPRPKPETGTEIRIPGLGKLGVLPKMDFGLELLYGAADQKQPEGPPEAAPNPGRRPHDPRDGQAPLLSTFCCSDLLAIARADGLVCPRQAQGGSNEYRHAHDRRRRHRGGHCRLAYMLLVPREMSDLRCHAAAATEPAATEPMPTEAPTSEPAPAAAEQPQPEPIGTQEPSRRHPIPRRHHTGAILKALRLGGRAVVVRRPPRWSETDKSRAVVARNRFVRLCGGRRASVHRAWCRLRALRRARRLRRRLGAHVRLAGARPLHRRHRRQLCAPDQGGGAAAALQRRAPRSRRRLRDLRLRAGAGAGARGLPGGHARLVLAAAILLSSLFHFSDLASKGDDYSFIGFPAVWNLVAFYLFALQRPQWATYAIVGACIALTFVPMRWVHPLRVVRLAAR